MDGLCTDWNDGIPLVSWFQKACSEANDDLNKSLSGLQDVDVEDDPPALTQIVNIITV